MPRKIISIILPLILISTTLFSQQRPKVGLVLSGGGARGFAHIGIIKMLDSLDISIDYIAGTSMGGILGALHSIGYSGREIEEIILSTDWIEIFTDKPPRTMQPYFQKKDCGRYMLELGIIDFKPVLPAGMIIGQEIFLLFSKYIFPFNQIYDFNKLPIPFKCVAVNLQTGREFIIDKGPLDKAMRTTMAIPSVFSPVSWGDSLYIDGGLINNLPVDVVRKMGADIVIAVDVMGPQKRPTQAKSILDVFERTISILGIEKWHRNSESADIYIQPDLDEFTMFDFTANKIKAIIASGDSAAKANMGRLLALRERENLQCFHDVADLEGIDQTSRIQDIQISGPTSMEYDKILKILDCKKGDTFNSDKFLVNLDKLEKTGLFSDISYQIIPVTKRDIRLAIRVKPLSEPRIADIAIGGNVNHSDLFIYRLIGLKAGDLLNTEDLHRRIMALYSYRYFKKITYKLIPADDNSVHLQIFVQEKPLRQLRLGLRFDNHHKFVGVISGHVTDIPFTGIRAVNEIQYAGLWKYMAKIYYPLRTFNVTVYPFVDFNFHDLPLALYNSKGETAANYKLKAINAGAGLGLFLTNYIHADISFKQETINVHPTISSLDPEKFPRFQANLRQIRASLDIDLLDDIYMTKRGFHIKTEYEGSYYQLGSDLDYRKISVFGDFYKTIAKRHTGRLYYFAARSTAGLPLYKFFNQGRPDNFVGIRWDQLFARQMDLLRIEYRLQLHRFLYCSLIGNTALNIKTYTNKRSSSMSGFGIGLTFAYPLGSLQLIVSRGHKNFTDSQSYQNAAYLSIGAKF